MQQLSNEALGEFFAECDEIIQRVSSGLQSLEKDAPIVDIVGQVYRDMHTMKGSAQLFGFSRIGQLAHCMEACLDPIRKQHAKVSSTFVDAALKTLDLIDRIIKGIREGQNESSYGSEVEEQIPRLIEEASTMFDADFRLAKDTQPDASSSDSNLLKNASQSNSQTESQADSQTADQNSKNRSIKEAVANSPTGSSKEQIESTLHSENNHPAHQDSGSSQGPSIGASASVANKAKNKNSELEENPPAQGAGAHEGPTSSSGSDDRGGGGAQAPSGSVDTTIRVQVGLLDRLMNLVGELVLVRNQVTQYTTRHDDLEFVNMSQSLNVVTTELQNEVMLTRMQPIGVVVNKFQRVARDLARDLNKKIDLTLQGAETELDKTLLEAIKDPLTHIVRNACDHGIETIAERKAASKPETGHILIRAFHDGGQVFIEVSDDGKGLDRERILQKAIERKLITPERAAKMSDREVCQIIFLPGFSTAKQVTNVSGRGVGMDVVKTNIEKIGGTAEVVSTFKRGTTIRLKIPLTLAIVPAMLIRCGKSRFAIPQVKLVELVRVDPAENKDRIEMLQGRPMYRLRGELLPIVRLDETLATVGNKLGVTEIKDSEKITREIANIVVLSAEGEMFGLLVDEILDTADIVVKPLGSVLKQIALFSGATILGDGAVVLIIDVIGLAEASKIDTKSQRRSEGFLDNVGATRGSADAQEFLLIRLAADAVHSIPLCVVNRLEEFAASDIEISGAQQVVRYRENILPIISLNRVLGYKTENDKSTAERISVVVVQRSGRNYGISVDEVLDVVTSERAIDDGIRDRAGIIGNLLLSDEVIVVVDALGIIEAQVSRLVPSGAVGESSGKTAEEIMRQAMASRAGKVRILFAEDVPFFRKQVGKVLTGAGYEVRAFEDGAQALKALEEAADGTYDLILSDIEMPNKNGLEFARDVRAIDRFKHMPMIALTTRFRQKDIDDGKAAGFDVYLEKLNSDILLTNIGKILSAKASKVSNVSNVTAANDGAKHV